jgi:ABC-2 type transport system permease protein
VCFGLVAGLGLVVVRVARPERVGDIALVVFAVLFMAWVLGPLLGMASDSTLDPDRLALLPLAPRQLIPGLLLAATVGFGGLFTVLALAGAVVGLMPLSGAAVVTVVAVLVLFATCVAGSRLAVTALSGAARTRRGRDVAVAVAPLTALAFNFGLQIISRRLGQGHAVLPKWGRLTAELLPSGPAALAVGAARQGRVLVAVAWLVPAAGVLVAIGWLWGLALERVLTVAEGRSGGTASAGRRTRRVQRQKDLFPRLLPFLPRTRLGAEAAKDLRVSWRDPRLRAAYGALIFPLLAPFLAFGAHLSARPSLLFVTAGAVFVLGLQSINELGIDGARYWTNVAAGEDMRSDLLGKNLARAVVAGGFLVVSLPVLAAITGGWTRVPAALGLAAVAMGVTLGTGNVTSVLGPVPIPESRTNMWGSGNMGQGLAMLGPTFGAMVVDGALVTPFAVASFLVHRPLLVAGLIVVEVAVGVGVWQAGLAIGVRRARGRLPELLARLSPRVSG